MDKTCHGRLIRIFKITRVMASLCGADVFRDDYKMGPITWFCIISINMYFLCTMYTIYVGFVVDGDWKVILQSLSLVGSGIQGYTKLIFCISRRLILITLSQTLENIYKEYQTEKKYRKILTARTDLTTKLLKVVLSVYIMVVSTVIIFPVYHNLRYNERILAMQFRLPGIDPLTNFGYFTHNIFQSMLALLAGFGNFAGDMFVFIFATHVPLFKEIIQEKFKELNVIVLDTHDKKKTIPLLREIVKYHKQYNKFVKQVEEVYYVIIFVQVFTSVMSICCTLFSIIIGSWPAAFSYLIYSAFILYVYCGLGNLVEISNDELVDVIYTDCLWYELSIPEQKVILLMLKKAQSSTMLSVGQIMPLSMSTALQLTKAIYSYMMMILQFLEED